jgi:putative PIN family toxin of toxin-antitoxin system
MPAVVVLDTNVLLSALLSLRGNPFRCVALAKAGLIQSVTCDDILHEFREKLETKFDYSPGHAQAAADELRSFSRLVSITHTLKVVSADPDDDKIIECAVVGQAEYIITGDRRHLLPLGSYQAIRIVSPADFLTLALPLSS